MPAQFIVHRNKVPVDPSSGLPIDPHQPSAWMTYEAASESPGFVLTDADPYFCIDIDRCYDPATQVWSPLAVQMIDAFRGAYMELSVSGAGLHIWGKCDKRAVADRATRADGIEFYTARRFIALGKYLDGSMDGDWTNQVLRVVRKKGAGELFEAGGVVDPAYTGPADDEALIGMMLASRGGVAAQFGDKATVGQLWAGDTSKYPSASEADAALMSHLAFWTGRDMPRMDRLFRRSGLMRPKYAERPDYAADTVSGAAKRCARVYDVVRAVTPPLVSVGEYMTIPDQMERFKGCVYVAADHAVMVPGGRLLKPETFNVLFGGKEFQMQGDGGRPTRRAFEAFTENRAHVFPRVDARTFRPDLPTGAIVDNMVNTYRPSTAVGSDGDVGPFMALIERMMPVESDRAILLDWMAHVVQRPANKLQWAIVMQGSEGNGKSFIGHCLTYAVGEHLTHLPNAKDMTEKYNDYVEGRILVVVEEIHMEGRREFLDMIKPLITGQRVEIRAMNKDKRMASNYTNWLFFTNHRDAILKSKSDRRFAVFFTSDHDGMRSDIYFPILWDWARAGGFAAVVGYLRNRVLPLTIPHRAPRTSSHDEVVDASMGPIEAAITAAIEDGFQGFRGGWVDASQAIKVVKERSDRPVSDNAVARVLGEMGYKKLGRCSAIIMETGKIYPTMYYNSSVIIKNQDNFMECQKYQRYSTHIAPISHPKK